jgi:hypothetical protein
LQVFCGGHFSAAIPDVQVSWCAKSRILHSREVRVEEIMNIVGVTDTETSVSLQTTQRGHGEGTL